MVWLARPIWRAWQTSRTPDHPSEMVYDAGGGRMVAFPSTALDGGGTVTLSVVVPAYNEEERMPAALDDMFATLKAAAAADT